MSNLIEFLFFSYWALEILILVLFLVDVRSAMAIALAPSLMALAGGLLPAVLSPVVPFIMISNFMIGLKIPVVAIG